MEAADSGGVTYAADQEGGFVFPDFLPSFDGAAALVNLIALLGRSGESLAQVVARVPELPVMRTEVETPFEQKGMVMRTLMEQLAEEGAELVLLDGIKVIIADRLGAGGARSRGADDPRVGRGRRPGRLRAAQPGLRRAAAPDAGELSARRLPYRWASSADPGRGGTCGVGVSPPVVR